MILLEGFLQEKEWKMILRLMPIPCVDVIVEKDGKVLLGFRTIRPYRNVWALLGEGFARRGSRKGVTGL